MKYRRFLIFASLMMFGAVLLGALGAHNWQSMLLEKGRLSAFETANEYHFYHAIGIMVVICLAERLENIKYIYRVLQLLSFGVVLFSGSLYIIALFDVTWIGLITPLGGLSLLLGWGLLSLGIYSSALSR